MTDEPWEFTCRTCGGHALIVTRVYDILDGPLQTRWREWGPLEDDHHWSYEEEEKEFDFVDYDAEYQPEEPELDEQSVEFYVNCADCDREIEFGWSHPDRMGRIWPAECSDFNPWKSWPEPRYRESWKQKNWLRPGTY